MESLDILYEDNHLLVVNKPAGIATMGADGGPTVHSLAADYLKKTYNKPGKAFVGIVSRLDAMTSGVLVLARTSKAASRLTSQFAGRDGSRVGKVYLAALQGDWNADQRELTDHVIKDDAAHRMRSVPPTTAGCKEAKLRYFPIARNDDATVVAVQLLTGRKHQIRVQFSKRGHPVLGDRKYGADTAFSQGIALHSWRLRIQHPTLRKLMWFEAPLPRSWKSIRRTIPSSKQILHDIEQIFDLDSRDSS